MKRRQRRVWFYGGLTALIVGFAVYATDMPGKRHSGPLPTATPEIQQLSTALRGHVVALAETIGERRVNHGSSLEMARDYLRRVARVASVLELARLLGSQRFEKSLRFVLFANEEPPYFQNPGMGSLTHARACRARGERIEGMLSLEAIGYYSDAPGSQRYPWPIGLLYPDRGDFVAFVGNLESRSLVRRAIGGFRNAVPFPSEGAALPAGVPGVDWSDHWAFWESGYRAILVTGTAVYRNPNYHHDTDRVGTLDYERLARVTLGLRRVIEELAVATQ